jgi:hypothetical protein
MICQLKKELLEISHLFTNEILYIYLVFDGYFMTRP